MKRKIHPFESQKQKGGAPPLRKGKLKIASASWVGDTRPTRPCTDEECPTRQMRLPFAETGEPPRAFWQARFYGFNVYSKGKAAEKLNFSLRDREAVNMHANPVIRKLVKHPKDWVWSSWGFYYGGKVLVAIDVEE